MPGPPALPGTSPGRRASQDGTLYPYYYPGDRLDRWQGLERTAEGGDALFTLGDAAASSSGGKVTVTLPFTAGSLYRHQRRLLQKPERLAQLYRHVHPVRPER